MTDSHGNIFWSEHTTKNTAAALAFYGKLCGWSFETMPLQDGQGEYYLCMHNGVPIAGILDASDMEYYADLPPQWITYIAVDDVQTSVQEAVKLGGSIRHHCIEVPGVGITATVVDPSGANVALMTRVKD